MIKISEKEYLRWKSRFTKDEDIIFSLINVMDSLLVSDGNSYVHDVVAKSAIACNARKLKEDYNIEWKGWFDYKEYFEDDY